MGKKMKIVRINGFRIPGLEYPSKPLPDLLELKNDDTELVVRDAPDAFVHFVEQNYENEMVAVLHAREAWKVEQEGGADAVIIRCNGEPGVKAARELCENTLVMGSACAVQHVASMLGRRFSYVIAGREQGDDGIDIDHTKDTLISAAQHYGLEHKLASIRNVNVPPTGFNEQIAAEEDLAPVYEEALEEAKKAVFEDGAEVIIGYGGPRLHDYLVKHLAPLGVPVLSTDHTLLKVAEMLVQLGLTQSKRTYPKPRQIYDFTVSAAEVVGPGPLPSS